MTFLMRKKMLPSLVTFQEIYLETACKLGHSFLRLMFQRPSNFDKQVLQKWENLVSKRITINLIREFSHCLFHFAVLVQFVVGLYFARDSLRFC